RRRPHLEQHPPPPCHAQLDRRRRPRRLRPPPQHLLQPRRIDRLPQQVPRTLPQIAPPPLPPPIDRRPPRPPPLPAPLHRRRARPRQILVRLHPPIVVARIVPRPRANPLRRRRGQPIVCEVSSADHGNRVPGPTRDRRVRHPFDQPRHPRRVAERRRR